MGNCICQVFCLGKPVIVAFCLEVTKGKLLNFWTPRSCPLFGVVQILHYEYTNMNIWIKIMYFYVYYIDKFVNKCVSNKKGNEDIYILEQ